MISLSVSRKNLYFLKNKMEGGRKEGRDGGKEGGREEGREKKEWSGKECGKR